MASPKIMLVCPECGLRFEPQHHRTLFCTPAHSKAYNNRQLAEGQRIVAMAKAWRMGKDASKAGDKAAAKDAFSTLCRELDALNRMDREAGRMPALKLFAARRRDGLLDFQGPVNRIGSRPGPDTTGPGEA